MSRVTERDQRSIRLRAIGDGLNSDRLTLHDVTAKARRDDQAERGSPGVKPLIQLDRGR